MLKYLEKRLDDVMEINELTTEMINKICEITDSDMISEKEPSYIYSLIEHMKMISKMSNDYGNLIAEIYHDVE